MTSDGGRGVHRGHDLDTLEEHKFQVFVVESFVADQLLQEGDELDCVVFVRLREIYVLQVYYQPLTLLGTEHTSLATRRLGTHLVQFLDHVECRSLGIAVDDCHLGRLHLTDLVANDEILAAAFRTDDDERVASLKPWPYHGHVSLDSRSFDNRS